MSTGSGATAGLSSSADNTVGQTNRGTPDEKRVCGFLWRPLTPTLSRRERGFDGYPASFRRTGAIWK